MFIEAKNDGGGGDNWTTGAVSRAKLQSDHHHQQTNIQFFTGQMPFLSPNSVKALKGKISHSKELFTPSKSGGLPTLSLTTNSSWLPWRTVAMPLISPLMPVPQRGTLTRTRNQLSSFTIANIFGTVLRLLSNQPITTWSTQTRPRRSPTHRESLGTAEVMFLSFFAFGCHSGCPINGSA